MAGVLFLLVTLSGLRRAVVDAISPSLRGGIAVGIGLFIAFIGLQNAGLVAKDPVTAVRLNPLWLSPDLLVFFAGLFASAGLHARDRSTSRPRWPAQPTTYDVYREMLRGGSGARGPCFNLTELLGRGAQVLQPL